MVPTKKIVALCILFSTVVFSQSKEGYWDNIRTTNETISLRAGEKKVIKTADFPEGTTELVYRITVLDDTQKLTSSLVSLLKAIPDPTGISQGTAGAVFLASTISGNDKCIYAIFSQSKDADVYLITAKTDKACFVQNAATNKEARILKTKGSDCMASKTSNLYFVFKSDNWVLNEKIILEVVPWVDNKASRGWDVDSKKELLKIAQNLDLTKTLNKKEQFCAVFIETISKKYKANEFSQLLPVEKTTAIDAACEESLKQTGEITKYYDAIRDRSLALFKKGKISEAIGVVTTEIIAKNKATSVDYALLGGYYLDTKQYSKAEEFYNKGIQLDPSEINFQLKLAHVYMFTDRLSEAKEIHKKFLNQNLDNGKTWTEQVKLDFKEFEKFGLPSDNFKKILRILE